MVAVLGDHPHLRMLQLITGRWISQALQAIATLGVADHLAAGPLAALALAQATGAHADALERLLRALASVGVFTIDGEGRYGLTPLGATLQSDAPMSLRAYARVTGLPSIWSAWGDIVHTARTGESAFEHVHGKNVFEYLAQHPDEATLFDEAMTSISSGVTPAVLASFDFSPFQTIVDVGGGRGHLLAGILAAQPRASGILFDLPHLANRARDYLAQTGVAGRCTVESGDFFEAVPRGGDLYLAKHVLHDWDDRRCICILENCRRAMREGSRLLVIEVVIPAGPEPHFGKLMDLEMLLLGAGGRERTAAQLEALLARAGLEMQRVVATRTVISIVEALLH
jgi:hypothetical protein